MKDHYHALRFSNKTIKDALRYLVEDYKYCYENSGDNMLQLLNNNIVQQFKLTAYSNQDLLVDCTFVDETEDVFINGVTKECEQWE